MNSKPRNRFQFQPDHLITTHASTLAGGLSPLGQAAFDRLIRFVRVAVPDHDLIEAMVLAGVQGVQVADDLGSTLDELETAGLAIRWVAKHETNVVTLSAQVAHTVGLKLNDRSTRWIAKGVKIRSEILTRRDDDQESPGYRPVISEADLTFEDEIFDLKHAVDPRAGQPLAILVEREMLDGLLSRERQEGYVRPTRLIGDNLAWPVDDLAEPDRVGSRFVQDRWPFTDSPAMKDKNGKPLASRKGSRSRPAICPACRDNLPLGGYCLVCGAYFADCQIPQPIKSNVRDSISADRRNVERGIEPRWVAPTANPKIKGKAPGEGNGA